MLKKHTSLAKKAVEFPVWLLHLLYGRYQVYQLHEKASTCLLLFLLCMDRLMFLQLTWQIDEATSVASML